MSFLVQDADDFDELNDPGFATEYRGDDFDGDMSVFVDSDASIALDDPAFGQVGNLFASRAVTADAESVVPGAGCFDFNAEGKFLGDSVGVGRVSRCFCHLSGVRRACLGYLLTHVPRTGLVKYNLRSADAVWVRPSLVVVC